MSSESHPCPIAEYDSEAKSLAAVILRRNISATAIDSQDTANVSNNLNLWQRLSAEAKEVLKTELLKTLSGCLDKAIIHKVCNLVIEVGGTMFEMEEAIWQDLLNMLFSFVNSENDI